MRRAGVNNAAKGKHFGRCDVQAIGVDLVPVNVVRLIVIGRADVVDAGQAVHLNCEAPDFVDIDQGASPRAAGRHNGAQTR